MNNNKLISLFLVGPTPLTALYHSPLTPFFLFSSEGPTTTPSPPPLSSPYLFSHLHIEPNLPKPKPPSPPPPPPTTNKKGQQLSQREHEMVGLSVVLEGHRDISTAKKIAHHQVINKASMIKSSPPSSPTPPPPASSPAPFTRIKNPFGFSSHHSSSSSSSSRGAVGKSGFLEYCYLCKQKLLPGKDIYMYK